MVEDRSRQRSDPEVRPDEDRGRDAGSDAAGETLILRRTRAQRIAGTASWGLCAVPLLAAVPFVSDRSRTILIAGALIGAAIGMLLDVLVRREVSVELSARGLRTGSTVLPWWSIEALEERRRLGVRTLRVDAFGLTIDLAAPRTGPLVRNPEFDREAALVARALVLWRDEPGEAAPHLPSTPPVSKQEDLRSSRWT